MGRDKLFGERLKEARKRSGLSQKQLGIHAGLDQFVASPRINRYERCIHTPPDIETTERLAQILAVPAAYFYTRDDLLAEIILHLGRLGIPQQEAILKTLQEMAEPEG